MAIAAQATTENKLRVTGDRDKTSEEAVIGPPPPCTQRAAVAATSPTRLPTSAGWAPVASCLWAARRMPGRALTNAFAVVAVRMSALRLSAAISRDALFFRIAANSERRVATSLIAPSR